MLTQVGPSAAAGCAELPVLGEGVVTAVVDARTVRLADGAEVRLAGVEPVSEAPEAGVALLVELTIGRRVVLHGTDDTPDRYGRQSAFVVTEPGAELVQRRLLAAGRALVGIDRAPADCRKELLAVETAARAAASGIWVEGSVIKNAANSGDMVSGIGRFSLVEGRIVSVREVGSTVYLNFSGRWTHGFAVTISRRVAGAIEAAGVALKSLTGRRIRVRGWIEKRVGPVIVVRDPAQMERAGGD